MIEIKNQLVKNTASSIFQIITSLITGLILPPILIAKLGLEIYGIWGLIVLLNQYAIILDLGLQSGLIKLISELFTKGDNETIRKLFSANILIYLIIITFIFLSLILFKTPIMGLFFGYDIKYKDIFDIGLIYSLASIFSIILLPYSSLIKGLHRYDISNLIDIVSLLINAILSIIFILLNFGLFGLIYGFIISIIIKYILLIIVTKYIYSNQKLYIFSFNIFKYLKLLFNYAPADLSVKIFGVLTQTLIRFSIKYYAGLPFVGIYDIAKRIVNQVSGLSSSIFISFLPAMSTLSNQNRKNEISEILNKASLFLNLLSLPVIFYLLFFLKPILILWLNISDVTDIQFAASILLIATFLDLLTGPITIASIGFGVIRLQIIKTTFTFVAILVFVMIFGHYFGFKGIIISELVANFFGMLFSILFFDKLFKYTYTKYLSHHFINISKVTFSVIFVFFIIWEIFFNSLKNSFFLFSIVSVILITIIIFKILLNLNIISIIDIKLIKNIFFKRSKETNL